MDSEIRYATNDDVNIAYRIDGTGKKTIVVISGWVSNIDEFHLIPGLSEWITGLTKRGRVVVFDKRGVGLSDRVSEKDLPGLGERMEDLKAIMDREKIGKAILYGFSEGGPMALYFAATYPERVEKLILYGAFACWVKKPGYDAGLPYLVHEKSIEEIRNNWGEPIGLELMSPSQANDPVLRKGFASFLRKSASPGAAIGLYRMNLTIDVRDILKDISIPALIIHRKSDRLIPVKMGAYLAQHIPGARFEMLEGDDHWPWVGNHQEVMNIVDDFLGSRIPDEYEFRHGIKTILGMKFSQPVFTHPDENEYPVSTHTLLRVFGSPDMALAYINRGDDRLTDMQLALIHTGPCSDADGKLSGSTPELLTHMLHYLKDSGFYLTLPAVNLVSDKLHGFSVHSVYKDPVSGISVPLYLYHGRKMIMNKKIKSILKEGKITLEDIAKLEEIRNYLENHYLSNPSLITLCRKFGINSFKLKYGFKQLFGISVKNHIRFLRLNYGHLLVRESDLPIEDIAFKTGYSHTSTFTAAFTSMFGESPTLMRKSIAHT